MHMNLWIPTPSVPVDLVPGSAIVSSPDAPSAESGLLCYFEGNLYGASNIVTYADRAMVASDRLLANYPTSATAVFNQTHLTLVGSYDTESGDVSLDPDRSAELAAWLQVTPQNLQIELRTTAIRHIARRELATMNPIARRFLRTHGPSIYRDEL